MDYNARAEAEKRLKKTTKQWDRERRWAEFYRLLGKKPMQYKKIPVADWDERTGRLSAFRKAYAEFFNKTGYTENSSLQSLSTQMFWHVLYLQKQRQNRLGITMEMDSQRVKRTKISNESIRMNTVFDGRYDVSEVNEAIYSRRTFLQHGEEIGTFRDYDSVNYSVLSAKKQGENNVICPNCGCVTTREDLIDGCDFCSTKFTVEDLEDRVGGFNFQIEVAREGLSDAGRQAGLYFDDKAGEMVREFDPNFSFRNFRTNIYNKIAAIHFADNLVQVNAFSDCDLSEIISQYNEIINIDFVGLRLWDSRALVKSGHKEHNDYYVEDGIQNMECTVTLVLFGLVDGKVMLRNEVINLKLEKSADCKTQNICGPSVLKCKGCGSSRSLMDGKTCPYCGGELDLKLYDWVITKYESNMSEYGKSHRVYN